MGRLLGSTWGERLVVALAIAFILIVTGFVGGVGDSVHLLLLGLYAMVPIALAAAGEVVNERGGLFNIGIEGIMLVGSFSAVYVAEISGNWFVGILGGIAVGALLAAIFGIISTYGGANQVIAGIGINIFGLGFVAYYLIVVWGNPGFHHLSSAELRVPLVSTPATPLRWMILIAIAIGFVVHYVLNHTRFGLRVRAAGFNPFVTDVSGVDVHKLRTMACIIGGALAGFGGAYMALDWLGLTARDLIQGRGFIALACVVFSGLDAILALEAALLFGLFNAIGLWLQNVPWARPIMLHGGNYLFLMLPYLAVLAVLVVFPRRERLSKEIGAPYRRE